MLGKMETKKYLEMLEPDIIKSVEMEKKKKKKEYFRRTRKLLETKQEKKEEEDLSAFKIVSMQQYNASKTTFKNHGGRLITATRNNTNDTSFDRKSENKNGKKNNCTDISSDKQAKSHT